MSITQWNNKLNSYDKIMNFLTNTYHHATKEKLKTIIRIKMKEFSLNHYTI